MKKSKWDGESEQCDTIYKMCLQKYTVQCYVAYSYISI